MDKIESLTKEIEELRKGLMLNGLLPNYKDAEIIRLTSEYEGLMITILEICNRGDGIKQDARLKEIDHYFHANYSKWHDHLLTTLAKFATGISMHLFTVR